MLSSWQQSQLLGLFTFLLIGGPKEVSVIIFILYLHFLCCLLHPWSHYLPKASPSYQAGLLVLHDVILPAEGTTQVSRWQPTAASDTATSVSDVALNVALVR